MSDSPVSLASNGKVEILLFEGSFTFPYVSDIILRGSDQVSAKRGWSSTSRQGRQIILVFLISSHASSLSFKHGNDSDIVIGCLWYTDGDHRQIE